MNRITSRAWVGAVVLITGCLVDPPTEASEPAVLASLETAGQCGVRNVPDDNFEPHYGCGAAILVRDVSSGGHNGALRAAATEWNAVFPSGYNLPRFVFESASQSGSKWVRGQGTSSGLVEGQAVPDASWNYTVNTVAKSASSSGYGYLTNVMLHEFSHVVGFVDDKVLEVGGRSDHCVTSPDSGSVYTQTDVCQHLIEHVLYAYSVRSSRAPWDKHIVTALVGLPTSIALYTDSTKPVTIESLRFDRAHPDLCGGEGGDLRVLTGLVSSMSVSCSLPTAGAGATWVSSNPGVVQVLGSGFSRMIQGIAPGTATITVTPSFTGMPYGSAALLRTSFPVTVQNSPPPPPPPSVSFTLGSCKQNTKQTEVTYALTWSSGALPGSHYEIRHSNVEDVNTAPLMSSGLDKGFAWTPWYVKSSQGPQRYWWIRGADSGGNPLGEWTANGGNGQILADGCVY